jgi:hypothetical protein
MIDFMLIKKVSKESIAGCAIAYEEHGGKD